MRNSSFTEEDFKAWVLRKPNDFTIGRVAVAWCCPIANYLIETQNDPTIHVGREAILYINEEGKQTGDCRPLPSWAIKVIAYVDSLDVVQVKAKHLKEYYANNSL